MVDCCFYRTHQVLVHPRARELQGQLHRLSVRVRGGEFAGIVREAARGTSQAQEVVMVLGNRKIS